MSFNTTSGPAPSSYSGPGVLPWAQLLSGVQPQQQQQNQQGQGNNSNSLGAAIMAWLKQAQQPQQTTPPTTNVQSNFNPNTSAGGVY